MVKLRFYISRKSLWAHDVEKLKKLCDPYISCALDGEPVRVQLRVSTSMRNPVQTLNAHLERTMADFRLVRVDGAEGPKIQPEGAVYVYIRGLTLTELVG